MFKIFENTGRAYSPDQPDHKAFFLKLRMAENEISNALTQGSIGISVLGIDAKTPRSLFSHANQALLEMHSGHKHRVSFYDQAIHKQIEQK
ncbi:hypothetical protein CIK04_27815, partial [Vibrio sp. 03_296]|uniref:hypothetical protein n=1 Tax=Vibrio sp. 03_296 TaxID=2024409 RepID=UPI000BCF2789